MKTPCLLLAFSFCAYMLCAQTYFAPIGTKWYNSRSQDSPIEPNPSYTVFTAIDTVVIQGKKCVEIQGGADCLTIPGSLYVYQENQKVFFTNDSTQPFVPLYDFDAGVGQKFTTFTFTLQQSAIFRVTAVDTVVVGTQSFRIQHIELDSGYVFLGNKVVEFVGGWTLFPQSGVCDPELGPLWCYNNGTFSYPVFPCGIVGTVEESVKQTVQIAPNPASDFFDLQINSRSTNLLDIEVHTLQGNIVFKESIITTNSSTTLNLDARDWPSGMYFLKIGPDLCKKLIVQH